LGDDLRVTVVATGLGEPVRSSLTREQPVRLVANGTTGSHEKFPIEEMPVRDYDDGCDQRVTDTGSEDLFERQKDIDYLDIPSFLRTQAD
jgi:cell division protein FtsZ